MTKKREIFLQAIDSQKNFFKQIAGLWQLGDKVGEWNKFMYPVIWQAALGSWKNILFEPQPIFNRYEREILK